jgi:hypothetical protein
MRAFSPRDQQYDEKTRSNHDIASQSIHMVGWGAALTEPCADVVALGLAAAAVGMTSAEPRAMRRAPVAVKPSRAVDRFSMHPPMSSDPGQAGMAAVVGP